MSTQPMAVPEKKRPTLLWWILGLLGAGTLLLGIGGVFLAWYLARHMEISTDGSRSQVNIQTPLGGLKVDKNGKTDPGLPIYPGASRQDDSATVELSGPTGDALHIAAAKYSSADSLEKIDTWYRTKLGPEFERRSPGRIERKRQIMGVEVKELEMDSADISFLAEKKEFLRVVALERRGSSIRITLLRMGSPETQ
ncbi:MAG: hypothetical protein HY046_05075 [Acidobacteria bacterium]|nr:hypothetical protein [Acidobacteriota bacterium]